MTVKELTAFYIIFQKTTVLKQYISLATLTLKTTSKNNTKEKYSQALDVILLVIGQNLLEKFLHGYL